jgi:hypothetical protein
MKKIFTSFILALFFLSNAAKAEIIETKNFHEIYQYIDDETLVVLDIDDTLLVPNQMLGCDEWFINRIKDYKTAGKSFEDALDTTLFEWEGLRSITKMQLVEETIDTIIKDLQSKNIMMMCLTTQRFALAPRTVYQLTQHNINIEKTAPCDKNLYFEMDKLGVLYFDGILFTNGTHKGKTFFEFCNQSNIRPKKIVFVNDKSSHLKEIEDSCAAQGIPFIGLRYGYSDFRKKAFDYETAKIQSQFLNLDGILSDATAEELKVK